MKIVVACLAHLQKCFACLNLKLLSFSIQTVILAITNLNFDLHHQSRTPLQTREALKITNLNSSSNNVFFRQGSTGQQIFVVGSEMSRGLALWHSTSYYMVYIVLGKILKKLITVMSLGEL